MIVLTTLALAAALGLAAVFDLRTRRIPNWLTIGAFTVALAIRALPGEPAFLAGLGGAGIGFLLVLPLMALGAMGGGDAKLLIAVGAFAGPEKFLWAMLLIALIGGAWALVSVARQGVLLPALFNTGDLAKQAFRRGTGGIASGAAEITTAAPRIPYGVAIAVGTLAAWFLI